MVVSGEVRVVAVAVAVADVEVVDVDSDVELLDVEVADVEVADVVVFTTSGSSTGLVVITGTVVVGVSSASWVMCTSAEPTF